MGGWGNTYIALSECFARNKDLPETWCASSCIVALWAMECDKCEVVSSGNWWSSTRESQGATMPGWGQPCLRAKPCQVLKVNKV